MIGDYQTIVTRESWEKRNELAEKWYPNIWPLEDFGLDKIGQILDDVDWSEKPGPHHAIGAEGDSRPMALIPSRSWVEWHLFRGVAPNAIRPTISQNLRRSVIERDGYTCGICWIEVDPDDVHLDHVKPFSKGGETTLKNLRVTHSLCNMRKGANANGTHPNNQARRLH